MGNAAICRSETDIVPIERKPQPVPHPAASNSQTRIDVDGSSVVSNSPDRQGVAGDDIKSVIGLPKSSSTAVAAESDAPSKPKPFLQIANTEHRQVICMFCRGSSCKREDWTKQTEGSAFQGLHSTWITATMCASQRMSTRLIKQHNLIKQFKEFVPPKTTTRTKFLSHP